MTPKQTAIDIVSDFFSILHDFGPQGVKVILQKGKEFYLLENKNSINYVLECVCTNFDISMQELLNGTSQGDRVYAKGSAAIILKEFFLIKSTKIMEILNVASRQSLRAYSKNIKDIKQDTKVAILKKYLSMHNESRQSVEAFLNEVKKYKNG